MSDTKQSLGFLRRTVVAALLVSAATFAASSHADLVEFTMRGRVISFNEDTPMPGVQFGTRVKATFEVDTSCTGGGLLPYEFNDDGADPTLLRMSFFGATFRSMVARIGPNRFKSEIGDGQIHVQELDGDISYLLSMNAVVNRDQPDFWVVFAAAAPTEDELRASELLAPDGFTRLLAHFREAPVADTTISVGGFNDITTRMTSWRVRVLKKTTSEPCAPVPN